MNTIEQTREVAKQVRYDATRVARHDAADTIDVLIAELEKAEASAKMWHDHAVKRTEEIDALKQQEPVATKIETNQFDSFQVSWDDAQKLQQLPVGTKLYIAAGAQP